MVAKSVHVLATCAGNHVVGGPQFRAEFAFQVNVEVLVFSAVAVMLPTEMSMASTALYVSI